MTPELTPLYLASLGTIAALILFARHNKKTGWVKRRRNIIDDLMALRALWDETGLTMEVPRAISKPSAMVATAPTAGEAAAFTGQLGNLFGALGRSTKVSEKNSAGVLSHR